MGEVAGKMQEIGTLPDGRTLYYAGDGFQREGYVVWDPVLKDHVPFVVASIGEITEEIKKMREMDCDLTVTLSAARESPANLLIRTEVAPANGRGYWLIRINPD